MSQEARGIDIKKMSSSKVARVERSNGAWDDGDDNDDDDACEGDDDDDDYDDGDDDGHETMMIADSSDDCDDDDKGRILTKEGQKVSKETVEYSSHLLPRRIPESHQVFRM